MKKRAKTRIGDTSARMAEPKPLMECGGCWRVYDPAAGDPVWRIEPGKNSYGAKMAPEAIAGRIAAIYGEIQATAMRGAPICNDALVVEAGRDYRATAKSRIMRSSRRRSGIFIPPAPSPPVLGARVSKATAAASIARIGGLFDPCVLYRVEVMEPARA